MSSVQYIKQQLWKIRKVLGDGANGGTTASKAAKKKPMLKKRKTGMDASALLFCIVCSC